MSEDQRSQLKQLQESKNVDTEVLIPVSSTNVPRHCTVENAGIQNTCLYLFLSLRHETFEKFQVARETNLDRILIKTYIHSHGNACYT